MWWGLHILELYLDRFKDTPRSKTYVFFVNPRILSPRSTLNHMEETLNIQRKGTRPTSACAGVGAP